MSSIKFKPKKKNDNTLLEQLCASLEDKFLIANVTFTVSGENGEADQQFAGKIILSRFPIEEKPTVAQR